MKRFLYKLLGWLGMAEGVIHLCVGLFSLWGASVLTSMFSHYNIPEIVRISLFTAPYENLFFGFVALTSGFVIKTKLGGNVIEYHHHHYIKDKEENEDE